MLASAVRWSGLALICILGCMMSAAAIQDPKTEVQIAGMLVMILVLVGAPFSALRWIGRKTKRR